VSKQTLVVVIFGLAFYAFYYYSSSSSSSAAVAKHPAFLFPQIEKKSSCLAGSFERN